MNVKGLHDQLKTYMNRVRVTLAASPGIYLAILALLVGVLSGFGAVLLYYLIQFGTWLFFGPFADWLAFLGPARLSLIGGLGGLSTGLLVYFLAQEAKGHGISEVIQSVAREKGIIRPRVVLVKAVTTALTIGSGGSAGREGPIAQIGAGIGSTVGQLLRISERQMIMLVACGAGAGIAATFNAPLGGSVFAMEVILNDFTASTFGYAVISSVSAALIARALLGNSPAFLITPYDFVHPLELLLYAVLGIAAGLVALLFAYTLNWTEDLFDSLNRVPEWVRPATGGILFGAIGIWLPQTLGRGEGVMNQVLQGQSHLALFLALLCFAKLITTSITLGSGGSGGALFPSMFIGACLGGSLGSVFHSAFPALAAGSGAYAIVGMGALFAGANQAPVTAILMLFEMTQDYRIILPIMLCCGISTLLFRYVSKESINTIKLVRRGIHLRHRWDVNTLRSVLVRDAMSTEVSKVSIDDTIENVLQLMEQTRHGGFPVVDGDGRLSGVITLEDIRRVDVKNRLATPVQAAMTRDPVTVTPLSTLADASRKMAFKEIGRLPVVEVEGSLKVVGILTRSDIVNAYDRTVLQSEEPGA
jgi:CIC family chloride channel protein